MHPAVRDFFFRRIAGNPYISWAFSYQMPHSWRRRMKRRNGTAMDRVRRDFDWRLLVNRTTTTLSRSRRSCSAATTAASRRPLAASTATARCVCAGATITKQRRSRKCDRRRILIGTPQATKLCKEDSHLEDSPQQAQIVTMEDLTGNMKTYLVIFRLIHLKKFHFDLGPEDCK